MKQASANDLLLKARFRDLMKACGGPRRCAEMLNHPESHLSAAGAAHVLDRWPRVDHVMVLEADCGAPIVTGFQADVQGFDLAPRGSHGNAASAGQHLSRIAKEASDVISGFAAAVADGVVTPREQGALVKEIHQMIAAGHAALADLQRDQKG